ncbi:MAG TPA: methyltransferase [Thermomicrobiaceae bacterium]|nr:methyltransferase [Thermomicrobiaceae bacterium]
MRDRATTTPSSALAAQLTDLIWGYQRTQLIYVAAVLGLADLLAESPRSVSDLAAASGTDAPSLARLLRALAAHGLFAEREDGRFELTPLAALLRSGTPGSLRAQVLAEGTDLYPLWGDLLHSAQTGQSAYEHLYGMPNWAYRERHPEANSRFNAYMSDVTRQKVAAVLANYRFPTDGVVVDVGGGDGTFLAALLRQYPALRGVLFDLPHVAPAAAPILAEAGVAERCALQAGDFFAAVPVGGDCYILSTVLHDWDDERSTAILRRCREAMSPVARLLVIERVLPADNSSPVGRLRDVHMLVTNVGGRERTEAEWRAVLAEGGFQVTQVTGLVAAGTAYHVIEADPVA